jgi:DNA-binding MarR family transcriptional regulator
MIYSTMRLEDEIQQPVFPDEFLKATINILVTADRISASTNAALKPYSISKEQFNVLRILRGQHPKPTALQEISCRMISRSSNATRLVEKLRLRGLVERHECPENRRKVDIVITDKGLALLSELDSVVEENSLRMRNISDDDAAQLNRILDQMRN